MPSSGALLSAVFVGSFVLIFFSLWILFFVKLVQSFRQRRVLKYTDAVRATELVGCVRQLKVRGHEEQAIQLVQDELAMPPKAARSWVKSI
ncbi:hypothetical protein [Nonomuraea wenchangensis]|uniref:Ribosomal protein L7/L12 C-terminal domain-containing protein n=1 Tax=Nonomuraea wenchangensis TaxID=568860 RepID=A0A1I0LU78_9ACTN|nr:hypothetical protein [Nonomuraea wenchangensis]SEU46080.1 hypothetical protein SAMN05421811_12691 [Nonomuraea wenchangensis]